jgi:hypothetical protein
MEFTSAAQKHAYLKAANAEMERYHHARELFKQGKLGRQVLKNNNNTTTTEGSRLSTGTMQIGVVTLFLLAFMATPLLGKRMAQDEEFRKSYIPTWYDFTVPKPENPWTREELHEQMIAVQREIRERAIRGDFKPEKLQEIQKSLEKEDATTAVGGTSKSKAKNKDTMMTVPAHIRKEWERIHPGLEDGEQVHED